MTELRFTSDQPAPERALELLRVLSQPVRTKILRAMVNGQAMRVSDVAAAVGEAPNSVSYHLRQLERAGIARHADPAPGRDGRETWWVVPHWKGLSFDIAALRALPGGDAVLHAFDESEAESILDLFSLARSEAADRTGWPGIRADGPLLFTREEADALVEQLVGLINRATEISRGHGANQDSGLRRYDYRLAFLPAADGTEPAGPSR